MLFHNLKTAPVIIGEVIYKKCNIIVAKCIDGYTVSNGSKTVVLPYLPTLDLFTLRSLLNDTTVSFDTDFHDKVCDMTQSVCEQMQSAVLEKAVEFEAIGY